MEGLQQGDYMTKLDMNDAYLSYLSVPLHETSILKVSFLWSEKMYEFIHLCFVLIY